MLLILLAAQATAFLVLIVRLAAGARRLRPVAPAPEGLRGTTVTVLVPTLNEAERLGPCLDALAKEGPPLSEVLVIDSGSRDGTPELVERAAAGDSRIRLLNDPPLPSGWIGKVWALQHGLGEACGDWVLGIDADVEPNPGLVAAVVRAAQTHDLELASFSPMFAGMTPGQRWLHPSLLLTLVYRFGVPTTAGRPGRMMANGQCFLARRSTLIRHGGYAPARASFADDVSLARYYAGLGVRVGFLDGSRLYRVRSYRSLGQLWREWGRSIDLSDATRPALQWLDLLLLALTQGIPLALVTARIAGVFRPLGVASAAIMAVNVGLLGLRFLMLAAIAGAYERRGIAYWLSPTSDPLAVIRLVLSTIRRPKAWRGRLYDLGRST